ncbi:MAG: protein-disulfide reductase DsbD family protein [Candidatus Methylacidiphilales bacterium]|nr:protein-disulfide reductase DsbD family protein [Candidatus Methylacidiphilales bacterium]
MHTHVNWAFNPFSATPTPMHRTLIQLFPLFFILGLPPASPLQAAPHTTVEAMADTNAIVPGVPFTVAVRMKMEPHWHTYWKNPGDSGLATTIQWALPEGFTAGPILWPVPKRIEASGLVSYGYEGEVVLLTELTPPAQLKTGQKITLKARVDWLECEDICVPGNTEWSLVLPVSTQAQPQRTPLFEQARSHLPVPASFSPVFEDLGGQWLLRAILPDAPQILSAWFFPDAGESLDHAQKQELETRQSPARGELRLRLPKAGNIQSPAFSGVLLVETPAGSKAYEIPPTSVLPRPPSSSFSSIVLLGFIGGLILNLMPCVFPVLGIKIMGLVGQSGEKRSTVARHGLAYTSGVLVSFWILAGLLLLLRAGGSQLGWGFQLQSPAFVFALATLMLVFALNMGGVFEVGTSLVSAGSALPLARRPTLSGAFFSGVLATIVATPCAAPFLAPALGAALALPPAPALVLFTVIALGLALPYLLLALFPFLANHLPRPGPWMESFKQGLAFLLYGAFGFLLWVLFGQLPESSQLSAVLGWVAVAAAAWIYGRWCPPARPPRVRRMAGALALLLALGGLTAGWPTAPGQDEIHWEPWSAERVSALRKEGRTVYVDFTARWCATCQTNKKVVFGSDEVRTAFRLKNVATLKADWTSQDPAITRELARWGRSAVPFNLVYLPNASDPVILPEILTPGVVLRALGEISPAH